MQRAAHPFSEGQVALLSHVGERMLWTHPWRYASTPGHPPPILPLYGGRDLWGYQGPTYFLLQQQDRTDPIVRVRIPKGPSPDTGCDYYLLCQFSWRTIGGFSQGVACRIDPFLFHLIPPLPPPGLSWGTWGQSHVAMAAHFLQSMAHTWSITALYRAHLWSIPVLYGMLPFVTDVKHSATMERRFQHSNCPIRLGQSIAAILLASCFFYTCINLPSTHSNFTL